MHTVKYFKFVFTLLVFTICILLSGCVSKPSQPSIPSSTIVIATTTPEPQLSKSAASYQGISVYTYNELVKRAEWIVIAKPIETLETYNAIRQSEDISKSSKDLFRPAQVIKLEVEEYLKGEGGKEIYFINGGSIIPKPDPSSDEINQSWSEKGVTNFKIGSQYLLFLNRCCNGASGFDIPKRDYVGGMIQPSIFEISPEGEISVNSPWEFASNYFSSLTMDEMIKRIKNPDNYSEVEISAYPAPSSANDVEIIPLTETKRLIHKYDPKMHVMTLYFPGTN